MSEHYTRSTVSAEAWCPKCQKRTQHRVDDRRIGPCIECMIRLECNRLGIPVKAAKDGELMISCTDATANYLTNRLAGKQTEIEVPLSCTCRSFRYPHSPEAHRHLGRGGDLDWRTWEERSQDHWEEW